MSWPVPLSLHLCLCVCQRELAIRICIPIDLLHYFIKSKIEIASAWGDPAHFIANKQQNNSIPRHLWGNNLNFPSHFFFGMKKKFNFLFWFFSIQLSSSQFFFHKFKSLRLEDCEWKLQGFIFRTPNIQLNEQYLPRSLLIQATQLSYYKSINR